MDRTHIDEIMAQQLASFVNQSEEPISELAFIIEKDEVFENKEQALLNFIATKTIQNCA